MKPTTVLRFWLFSNAGLVVAMMALGAITRLKGAGLSIVEWKPLVGILPPFSLDDWTFLFQQYQKSPEFQKINFSFTLEDFRPLFWLEYFHRLLGRILGLSFILPGLLFWMKGYFTPFLQRSFLGLIVLGILQGIMGWFMVKSGLINDPHVSPYRLAAHFFLAVGLYLGMIRAAFSLFPPSSHYSPSLKKFFLLLLMPLGLTLFYGTLVAGLKAGLIYNTFPLMGGSFCPLEIWALKPLWTNLFENPATVQLMHRWLACLTGTLIVGGCVKGLAHPLPPAVQRILWVLLGLVMGQIILGIFTLLEGAPPFLATLHQLGAVALLTGLVFIVFR